MILQKIKDVRVGQIWSFNKGKTYDVIIDVRTTNDNLEGDKLNPYEIRYKIYGDFNYSIGDKHELDKDKMFFIDCEYCRRDEKASKSLLKKFKNPNKYLIGFLGITHKEENGRLIEIPRRELDIDDVVEFCIKYDGKKKEVGVIVGLEYKNNIILYEVDYWRYINKIFNPNKLGILGVNYEFVNNKLVDDKND